MNSSKLNDIGYLHFINELLQIYESRFDKIEVHDSIEVFKPNPNFLKKFLYGLAYKCILYVVAYKYWFMRESVLSVQNAAKCYMGVLLRE